MFNFEFSVIRYEFEAVNSFVTPYFLGSTFRGILGKKLKKIVCIKPFTDCRKCEFKMTCPYTNIFESETMLNKPSRYIMRPPYENKELKEGDRLNLEITLLGDTANYWEFISQSFTGVLNLGKERYIKLKNIYYYHPFEDRYHIVKSFIPRFEACYLLELKTGRQELPIHIFPTSLKLTGRFITYRDFNKEIFIRAIVSRISNVSLNYGVKESKIFINKNHIELKDINLRPSPMKRWSNRKKTQMVIPAFEGSLKITGDINSIYPYLSTIELINLGKSVSFGLGKLTIL